MARSWIIWFVKIAVVAAFLYLLSKKGLLSPGVLASALSRPKEVGFALGGTLVLVLLSQLRWQLLLRARGIDFPTGKVIRLGFAGNFFNLALPGGVSGDVFKACYLSRRSSAPISLVLGTILFDRLAGVSALILVSLVSMVFGWESFHHDPKLANLALFIGAGSSAVLFFYAYVAFVQEARDPLHVILGKMAARFKKLTGLLRLYEGVRGYHAHRRVMVETLLLSGLIHFIGAWSCLHLAYALGEQSVGFLSLLLVFPLATLVNVVPLAPAGVGTGHVSFLYFFSLVGSSKGADLYSLIAVITILFGAVGAAFFLSFPAEDRQRAELKPA